MSATRLSAAMILILLAATGGQTEEPARRPNVPPVGKVFVEPPAIPPVPQALEAPAAYPAHGQPITLQTLETWACQNNPTLRQAQAQVEGALGRAIQAGLWPNPTFRYVLEQIDVKNKPGEFVGGLVQQRVVTAQKLDLSRAKFMHQAKSAEWTALAQQYRVLNDVRMHYFRTLGRRALIEIQNELLKNSEDGLVTAREMYNVGQAIRPEVHQANLLLQQRRLDLMMAQNDYRQVWEEMIALVGINLPPQPLEGTLEGDLTPITWEDALQRLMVESPELLAAVAKLRSDEVTVRREIVEPIPDIVVEGGAGYNYPEKQTVGMFTLSVEMPLFDWNQGTIRQAEADYIRQRYEVQRTRLMLRRQLAQQYRQYVTALQQVQSYQLVILPEAREAYETLLDAYKQDRAPWRNVLEAEQTFFTLRAIYVLSLMAWRESEALIVGYLLHNGLQPPTQPPPPGHINAVPKPR